MNDPNTGPDEFEEPPAKGVPDEDPIVLKQKWIDMFEPREPQAPKARRPDVEPPPAPPPFPPLARRPSREPAAPSVRRIHHPRPPVRSRPPRRSRRRLKAAAGVLGVAAVLVVAGLATLLVPNAFSPSLFEKTAPRPSPPPVAEMAYVGGLAPPPPGVAAGPPPASASAAFPARLDRDRPSELARNSLSHTSLSRAAPSQEEPVQPKAAEAAASPSAASPSSTDAAAPAPGCTDAGQCGTFGLISAADARVSSAFQAAVEAGAPQSVLGDARARWDSLRADTTGRPADVLLSYAQLAKGLWAARDRAIGLGRKTSDHGYDDHGHWVPQP